MSSFNIEKIKKEINIYHELTNQQIDYFRDYGYLKLENVLSPETLEYYGNWITSKVIELNTLHIPMEKRDTYQKAFLQVMNIWLKNDIVKELTFSKKLAKIAADLLGVCGVRLYHDQALYKEAGGGITPWHADQYYWPLSSEKTVTAWIPFQETPLDMGPLSFASKSQNFVFGRELPISDESEKQIEEALMENNFDIVIKPFKLGEISFHYGWTFHAAGVNSSSRARRVMTMIYMDKNMKLKEPLNKNQDNDMKTWCPGIKIGDIIDSEINPILYSTNLSKT